MKKILSVVTLAAVLVACNPNPTPDQLKTTTTAVTPDTTGFAQFQAWKAQNELQNLNNPNNQVANTQPETKIVRVYEQPRRTSTTTRRSSSSGNTGTYSSGSNTTAKTTQKKGWSKAAKGAVIGGVTGGVTGAVINKRNRVVGGVVGAVIGAGGGYVIGRTMDKKDGRVQ